MFWIPSHIGIAGKEKDEKAKGKSVFHINDLIYLKIPLSDFWYHINKCIQTTLQRCLDDRTGNIKLQTVQDRLCE